MAQAVVTMRERPRVIASQTCSPNETRRTERYGSWGAPQPKALSHAMVAELLVRLERRDGRPEFRD